MGRDTWKGEKRVSSQKMGSKTSQAGHCGHLSLPQCPRRVTKAISCRMQDSTGSLGPPGAGTLLPRSSASFWVFPATPLFWGFLLAPQPHTETPKGFCSFVQRSAVSSMWRTCLREPTAQPQDMGRARRARMASLGMPSIRRLNSGLLFLDALYLE